MSSVIALGCGGPALSLATAKVLEDISDDGEFYYTDDCQDESYDDNTHQWRGGSRGKGGKIKYARK